MMPRVCHEGGAFDLFAHDARILEKPFLDGDGNECHYECDHCGTCQRLAVDSIDDCCRARHKQADGNSKQGEADEHGGKGLEFSMAIAVFCIFSFRRNSDKHNDNHIGHRIGDGMDSVGYHGSGMADYAGGKIKLQEEELSTAAFFTRDHLPELPQKLSLARRMIDAWLEETDPNKP